MKEWPADDKTANFEDIVKPICLAIWCAYDLKRKNVGKDIPYNGLEVGRSVLATNLGIQERFAAEQLRYSEEEQGRDALTEIVSAAVQLGIEQGRRIEQDTHKLNDLLIGAYKTSFEMTQAELLKYKTKYGDTI